jgi:phage shock protein PspC (stress-responsive transcriptional regulator)
MKRIYRSRKDRMVAGVAAGIAEYFDIDPTLVRLVWVLLLIPGGLPGLLPYLVCWIIIPEEPAMVAGQLPLPEAARPVETAPATTSPAATSPAATPTPGTSASLPDVVPPAPPAAPPAQSIDSDGEPPLR